MSVRKRTWKSPNGEPKEAWVVDYVDQHGDRHLKTFAKKRDADAHHAIVGVAVRAGTHTADSKSVTVAKAAELWLESCEAAGLERTTIAAYRQHAELHIVPMLGALQALAADRAAGARLRGPAAPGRALAGHGAQGPPLARRAPRRRPGARPRGAERRLLAAQEPPRQGAAPSGNGKLKIGVDIPTPDEMRAIVAKLDTASGALPAAAADGDLHRAARLRAARPALGAMSISSAASCTCASAPIATARSGGRSRRRASAPCRCRRWWSPHCASTASPAQRTSRTSSSRTAAAASSIATPSSSAASIRRRSPPASSIGDGGAKYPGPAQPAPLLCLVVHQPARRWRARTAAQGGAGAARARLDPDDGGHLRPPVPARRRRRRAGRGRAGVPTRVS